MSTQTSTNPYAKKIWRCSKLSKTIPRRWVCQHCGDKDPWFYMDDVKSFTFFDPKQIKSTINQNKFGIVNAIIKLYKNTDILCNCAPPPKINDLVYTNNYGK